MVMGVCGCNATTGTLSDPSHHLSRQISLLISPDTKEQAIADANDPYNIDVKKETADNMVMVPINDNNS